MERRLEQGQRRLLLTFPAGRPGQHRVEARLARQDIRGSPLLLPVLQDPCRALAQLGLQQLAGESGGGLRKRPVFKAEGRTVAVLRQPRGPGGGRDGGFLAREGKAGQGVKSPKVLPAKLSQTLPSQAALPAKMSKTIPLEVLKVAKTLPRQVSEAPPAKPAKAFSSAGSSAPPASTKSSSPAPSPSAPVLEPGCHCFLLQGGLWYGGQVHGVIHEELVTVRNLGQGQFQGVHPKDVVLLPRDLPRDAELHLSATELVAALQDTPQPVEVAREEWEVGRRCVARWGEDGVWYRAEVLARTQTGATVIFTDYGNEAEVTEGDMVEAVEEVPADSDIDENVFPDKPEEVVESPPAVSPAAASSPLSPLSSPDQVTVEEGQSCLAMWRMVEDGGDGGGGGGGPEDGGEGGG